MARIVPAAIGGHVRARLAELGIDPMTPDDATRLRSIGQVFWPEAFDRTRAGLPVEPMDSQAL
jgi:hypothetical protein